MRVGEIPIFHGQVRYELIRIVRDLINLKTVLIVVGVFPLDPFNLLLEFILHRHIRIFCFPDIVVISKIGRFDDRALHLGEHRAECPKSTNEEEYKNSRYSENSDQAFVVFSESFYTITESRNNRLAWRSTGNSNLTTGLSCFVAFCILALDSSFLLVIWKIRFLNCRSLRGRRFKMKFRNGFLGLMLQL